MNSFLLEQGVGCVCLSAFCGKHLFLPFVIFRFANLEYNVDYASASIGVSENLIT